jgi:F-type H+-transporting ATPase subunit c
MVINLRTVIVHLVILYMEIESAKLIAKGLCTLSMFGSGIGEGYLIGKALEAMGRNPKMEGSIFTKMIIGVALAESTAIYAFVAFFIV